MDRRSSNFDRIPPRRSLPPRHPCVHLVAEWQRRLRQRLEVYPSGKHSLGSTDRVACLSATFQCTLYERGALGCKAVWQHRIRPTNQNKWRIPCPFAHFKCLMFFPLPWICTKAAAKSSTGQVLCRSSVSRSWVVLPSFVFYRLAGDLFTPAHQLAAFDSTTRNSTMGIQSRWNILSRSLHIRYIAQAVWFHSAVSSEQHWGP